VTVFPNTPLQSTSAYWSATPFQGGSSSAWFVSFGSGYSHSLDVNLNYRVRCVR
jgi:hypothetical protein